MSQVKYLDKDGLIYYHSKIRTMLGAKADTSSLGAVATSNDYNDLDNLPTIPEGAVVDSQLSNTSENAVQNKVIYSALGNKVDKVSGKGLSTNDYTTTEKNKLSGISSGAQVNVIETIQVNGTAQTVSSKTVNISVPTNNNQLTNGAGYQTSSQVQSAINSAISGITGISFEIVQSLPSTGAAGVIYLLSNSGSGQNIYDEYIYVNNKFEKIGTTDVDLSGYVQSSDLVAITNAEIDSIVA